jgi:hypothetical protein
MVLEPADLRRFLRPHAHELSSAHFVRREIGKESKVKVQNSEGIATQTGSESGVVHREMRREAFWSLDIS